MGSPVAQGDNKSLVLNSTDIVELIGQSVALKRRGKDFVGLCPFHTEKSPSFHVSPARQFFHCFGCKASGNAIDFVIKRDRVEFIEALRILADKAGIDLPKRGASAAKAGERQMLFDAHSAACQFFESLFWDPQRGAAARQYLAQRGFTDQTLKQFRVGLAPDAWDGLLRSPGMRKFPPDKLAEAGLAKARQTGAGGFYDTFRNRIMFPILEEAQARIIAFGGRVVPASQDPAKYLNSPETPLFSKGRTVYGLNFARQRMIETGTAVVVEGYTDVVMAHQYGASNVVSVLGTAMTEQHVNVLRRFAGKIVLLFDADSAGDMAADRVVELFLTQDVEIAIAALPEGLDPDEYFIKFGAEAFDRDVIGAAKDVLTFKWDQLARRMNASGGDVTSQQKAVTAYLDLLAQARGAGPVDDMRWGAVLSRISRLTEMPLDDLHRRFRKPAKPTGLPRRSADSSVARPQPAVETPTPAVQSPAENVAHAREVAERQILGILLREPNRWQQVQMTVHPETFVDAARRRLADAYWGHQRDEGEPVFSELLGTLNDDLKSLAIELLEAAEALADVDATLAGAMGMFDEDRRRQELQKQIAEIRRISQGDAGSSDAAALLEEVFRKKQASVDPRHLGPVRRTRS